MDEKISIKSSVLLIIKKAKIARYPVSGGEKARTKPVGSFNIEMCDNWHCSAVPWPVYCAQHHRGKGWWRWAKVAASLETERRLHELSRFTEA
ncbi:hypothetical protein AUP41_19965 [Thalassospira xiamenensis]|nr:hypothetical protein AUP41_19965 [Thalassospira xiamenensis]